MLWCSFLWAVCTTTILSAQQPRRVRMNNQLREISGLTYTRDGALWCINDGGHAPALFRLVPETGEIAETRLLPVLNRDWEDLTTDRQGRLYIGDFGNNQHTRRDLCIYRYDPVAQTIDSILFSYPDQHAFPPPAQRWWNFDCEAMVFYRDSLHLFSKNRFVGNFYTKHYVLPAQPGQYIATLRDSLLLPNRVVTGAALDSTNQTLALTAYYFARKGAVVQAKADVFFLEHFPEGYFLQGQLVQKRLPKFLLGRQFESITAGRHKREWWVANETIAMQKASIWRLKQ